VTKYDWRSIMAFKNDVLSLNRDCLYSSATTRSWSPVFSWPGREQTDAFHPSARGPPVTHTPGSLWYTVNSLARQLPRHSNSNCLATAPLSRKTRILGVSARFFRSIRATYMMGDESLCCCDINDARRAGRSLCGTHTVLPRPGPTKAWSHVTYMHFVLVRVLAPGQKN
jgi:hypothetical protein